jgi:hypothetical protein
MQELLLEALVLLRRYSNFVFINVYIALRCPLNMSVKGKVCPMLVDSIVP